MSASRDLMKLTTVSVSLTNTPKWQSPAPSSLPTIPSKSTRPPADSAQAQLSKATCLSNILTLLHQQLYPLKDKPFSQEATLTQWACLPPTRTPAGWAPSKPLTSPALWSNRTLPSKCNNRHPASNSSRCINNSNSISCQIISSITILL